MRVQALEAVAAYVQRDGEAVAMIHGQKEPEDGVVGSRVVSVVKVPPDAVVVTGGSVGSNQTLTVMALHVRHAGWMIVKHRVALCDAVDGRVLRASPWADGAWAGDSVLSVEFDPDMPPEANAV